KVPLEGPFPEKVEYKDNRILDTRSMEWAKANDGTMHKVLSPTVRLTFFPPAWKGPRIVSGVTAALVIYGDGALQASGTAMPLRQGSYIKQPQGDSVLLDVGDVGCEILEWTDGTQTRDAARSQ